MGQLGTASCLGILAAAVFGIADEGEAQTQRSQLGSTFQIAYDTASPLVRRTAIDGVYRGAAATYPDEDTW